MTTTTFTLGIGAIVGALFLLALAWRWLAEWPARRAKEVRIVAALTELREHGEQVDATWRRLQREALIAQAEEARR